MILGVDFYKNMETQSKLNVGKTVNMRGFVEVIITVGLVVCSA